MVRGEVWHSYNRHQQDSGHGDRPPNGHGLASRLTDLSPSERRARHARRTYAEEASWTHTHPLAKGAGNTTSRALVLRVMGADRRSVGTMMTTDMTTQDLERMQESIAWGVKNLTKAERRRVLRRARQIDRPNQDAST